MLQHPRSGMEEDSQNSPPPPPSTLTGAETSRSQQRAGQGRKSTGPGRKPPEGWLKRPSSSTTGPACEGEYPPQGARGHQRPPPPPRGGWGPHQASRAFLVSGQAQQAFSGFFSPRASPSPLASQLAAATVDMASGSPAATACGGERGASGR